MEHAVTTPFTSPLLNETQAAGFLGLTRRALQRWRGVGEGPQYLKIGRSVRYRREDLDSFLEGCTRQGTYEQGCHCYGNCASKGGHHDN